MWTDITRSTLLLICQTNNELIQNKNTLFGLSCRHLFVEFIFGLLPIFINWWLNKSKFNEFIQLKLKWIFIGFLFSIWLNFEMKGVRQIFVIIDFRFIYSFFLLLFLKCTLFIRVFPFQLYLSNECFNFDFELSARLIWICSIWVLLLLF